MQPMLYARPLLSKKVGGEEKCLEIINVTEHDQMFIFSGEEEGGEENCFILLPGGGDHCQTQRKGGGNITNTNTNIYTNTTTNTDTNTKHTNTNTNTKKYNYKYKYKYK